MKRFKGICKQIMEIVLVILFLMLLSLDSIDEDIGTDSVIVTHSKSDARGMASEMQSGEVNQEPMYEDLGMFTLTAYCNCSICCGEYAGKGITASGTTVEAGRTVAVDTNIIPFGTKLIINGHEYIAEDRGGGINGNHIDIYFNNHADALQFGRQQANVQREVSNKNGT